MRDPHQPIDVEISVVNTDNRALLEACLRSLPQACAGVSWHATVVDNGSQDGSADMVSGAFAAMRLIRNQRRLGFSANHNQVMRPILRAGSARYLLILNEDTRLYPGAVRQLVAFSDQRPRVGAAGPTIRCPDGTIQRSLFPPPTMAGELRASLRPGRPSRRAAASGYLNGSCVLLRLEALAQIGLLDERFFIFYEDADLGKRLSQAGWESAVCPEASVIHHQHQTVSKPTLSLAMERQMFRSEYLYFRKHSGRLAAGLVSALVRATLVARGMKALVDGVLRHDGSRRATARLLLALAAYHPWTPLLHERGAAATMTPGLHHG
jgi:GT2 family glycosyltransferase